MGKWKNVLIHMCMVKKKKKMPLYPSGEKHLDLDNKFPENDGFQGEPL